jgi:hypothetical protein
MDDKISLLKDVKTSIKSALDISSVVGGALIVISDRLEIALDTGLIRVSILGGILRKNVNVY